MSQPDLSKRPQMPRRLTWADDPWGISWRAKNLIKGFHPARTARFLAAYASPVRHPRPIFVIGAPRSGTTMMFHLLRTSAQLASLPGEGHNVWRMYHHPRYTGWESDVVGAGEIRTGERRFVNAYFYSWVKMQRLVEKTPENSLRIPYLLDLFPDARFIAVRRNPCDVISSLIRGWRRSDGRFRSYYVPQNLAIEGYAHRHRWCFTLVDGWRALASSTVPEIAFAQWRQSVDAIAACRSLVPSDRWIDVPIERLREAPDEMLERITERVGLDPEPELLCRLDELLQAPPNAASPPGHEKWRTDNAEEVGALLPRIAVVAAAAGYEIDRGSGDFRVL